MSVRQAIWGEKQGAIEASLKEVDEDLFRYIRDFAYEEVLARPGLDLRPGSFLPSPPSSLWVAPRSWPPIWRGLYG